jgi:hypothetical protein
MMCARLLGEDGLRAALAIFRSDALPPERGALPLAHILLIEWSDDASPRGFVYMGVQFAFERGGGLVKTSPPIAHVRIDPIAMFVVQHAGADMQPLMRQMASVRRALQADHEPNVHDVQLHASAAAAAVLPSEQRRAAVNVADTLLMRTRVGAARALYDTVVSEMSPLTLDEVMRDVAGGGVLDAEFDTPFGIELLAYTLGTKGAERAPRGMLSARDYVLDALGTAAAWSAGSEAPSDDTYALRSYAIFGTANEARAWDRVAGELRAARATKAEAAATRAVAALRRALPRTLLHIIFDRAAAVAGDSARWRVHVLAFERRRALLTQSLVYARIVLARNDAYPGEAAAAAAPYFVPVLDALVTRAGDALFADFVDAALTRRTVEREPAFLDRSGYVSGGIATSYTDLAGGGGTIAESALLVRMRGRNYAVKGVQSGEQHETLLPALRAYGVYEAAAAPDTLRTAAGLGGVASVHETHIAARIGGPEVGQLQYSLPLRVPRGVPNATTLGLLAWENTEAFDAAFPRAAGGGGGIAYGKVVPIYQPQADVQPAAAAAVFATRSA